MQIYRIAAFLLFVALLGRDSDELPTQACYHLFEKPLATRRKQIQLLQEEQGSAAEVGLKKLRQEVRDLEGAFVESGCLDMINKGGL